MQRRLANDRTAAATLLLFESDVGSADLQRRLAAAIAAHLPADELQLVLAVLRGAATTPHVRSRISADEDAVIERSGHSVSAAPGALDLATTAGKRGRISDSPITITGAP